MPKCTESRLARWAIRSVRYYQERISPTRPPCCRYRPTCSAYALEAFRRHGFVKGGVLTVWRILRCNPLSKGGYDPVPEAFWPWQRNNRNE